MTGAIDRMHVPIRALDYNHKGWYSVVLKALVDADGKFIDTNIGDQGVSMMLECL